MVVLGLLLIVSGTPISTALLAVPVIVVVQVMFTMGLVLLSSALYVLKRDLGSLLPLILQIWMFVSPVVYPVSLIPERYRTLYMLNPMASIMEAYRSAMLFGTLPSPATLAPALIVAVGVLVVGYVYFKAVEPRFADVM
jgi:ABC-type polysaccharide/polyol phosphate export permease